MLARGSDRFRKFLVGVVKQLGKEYGLKLQVEGGADPDPTFVGTIVIDFASLIYIPCDIRLIFIRRTQPEVVIFSPLF